MKRVILALATVALAAVALVGLSGVASAREAEPFAAEQKGLPPLPAEIKERKRLNIAVKCDAPPFGYIGARSQNAGFDVEIGQVVLALCVRQVQPRDLHVRHHTGPRARDHDGAGGHGGRDVHVHRRTVTLGSTSRGPTTSQPDDCSYPTTRLSAPPQTSPVRRS